jgi:DNA (cytosine-5)-methyltransferase 1
LFLENVEGILTANGGEALNRVMSDLAEIGFNVVRWACTCASETGAWFEGERWWLLAETTTERLSIRGDHRNREKGESQRASSRVARTSIPYRRRALRKSEPPVARVVHGMAGRIDRIKMLGNGQDPLQAAYAWVMLGGPTNL